MATRRYRLTVSGFAVECEGSRPSVAISRGMDKIAAIIDRSGVIQLTKRKQFVIGVEILGTVEFEWKLEADFLSYELGTTTRTVLPEFGPFKSKKEAELAAISVSIEHTIADGEYRHVRSIRVRKGGTR
jgi:hypothetical protein